MRRWPVTIRRDDVADNVSMLEGNDFEPSEIGWALDFLWDFIRDKESRQVLNISGNVPTILVAAILARLAGYYRLITVDGVVIFSRFPEFPLGTKG